MSAVRRAVRELVRPVAVPLWRALVPLLPGSGPPILLNSLPKAGTHLTLRLLTRLPGVRFSGHHLPAPDPAGPARDPSEAELRAALDRLGPGLVLTTHLPWRPDVTGSAAAAGVRVIHTLRDPRDVLVSHVHYVTRTPRHFLHDVYTALPDFETRARATLHGVERDGVQLLEPLAERLAAYRGWLEAEAVHRIRFEELIGPRGGGDAETQRRVVGELLTFLGRDASEGELTRLIERTWSRKAATFRRGQTGEWREALVGDLRAEVVEALGPEIEAAGYPSD